MSGLLVISAMSAVGILGIILGGWSSNSHYPLLGALRTAAQLVSYEVALSFALLSGVMVAGTLSMQGIVQAQQERGIWFVFANYGFMIVPFVRVYHRGDGRDEPRALRSAGSRIGAGGRVPHGVQRLSLGALLPGRVRQHFRGIVGGGDTVLGRMAAALPEYDTGSNPAELRVPVLLFAGSGAGMFPLIKKLKDPIQQKVLLGVAVLLIAVGADLPSRW